MKLELNMEKFNKARKEIIDSRLKKEKSLVMKGVAINVIALLLGFMVAGLAYIKLGISSYINLACFILGVCVCTMGIQNAIRQIVEYVSLKSGLMESNLVMLFGKDALSLMGIDAPLKARSIEFLDDHMVATNGGEGTGFTTVKYDNIDRVVTFKNSSHLLILEKDGTRDSVFEVGFFLGDIFNGYSKEDVINFLKEKLPEIVIEECSEDAEKIATTNPNLADYKAATESIKEV